METENVAIYLDFENLAISAEEVYPSKERPLLIGPIVDFATTKGNVCIKKAYADWSKSLFSQYQKRLIEHGFEFVHLPATTSQGKNGSDVKLAIDAMENMELFKTIDIFIIGSGDTDFIALIQRIRARGKSAIVIGFDHSVGNLIKTNSTEFKSLEELLGKPEEDSLTSDLIQEIGGSYGRELIIRYISNRSDDGPVPMAKLKQDLLRLDPSFSEKRLGFQTFKKFVGSLVDDLVDKIEPSPKTGLPIVYLKDIELTPEKKVDFKDSAKEFLKKSIKYLSEQSKRSEFSKILFEGFQEKNAMSMYEMVELISSKTENIPKITVRKFVNTLFTGKAFLPFEDDMSGPLFSRLHKLRETINNSQVLEQIYMDRVIEILNNRYPDLNDEGIKELL